MFIEEKKINTEFFNEQNTLKKEKGENENIKIEALKKIFEQSITKKKKSIK